MEKQFEIALFNRRILLKISEGLSIDQLNKIPDGFKNNIIWNMGHTLVTQQLLMYRLSGLECTISNDLLEKYSKGSEASSSVSEEEIKSIREQMVRRVVESEKDYNNGIFKEYNQYTTSMGFEIDSVEEALQFSNYHEGIHLGIILSMLKLVK